VYEQLLCEMHGLIKGICKFVSRGDGVHLIGSSLYARWLLNLRGGCHYLYDFGLSNCDLANYSSIQL
jgi:hypothetical protein